MQVLDVTKIIKSESKILTREFIATHLNPLTRSPERDCFVASAKKVVTPKFNIKNQEEFVSYLTTVKAHDGNTLFSLANALHICDHVFMDNPESYNIKAKLVQELVKNKKLNSFDIRLFVQKAHKEEHIPLAAVIADMDMDLENKKKYDFFSRIVNQDREKEDVLLQTKFLKLFTQTKPITSEKHFWLKHKASNGLDSGILSDMEMLGKTKLSGDQISSLYEFRDGHISSIYSSLATELDKIPQLKNEDIKNIVLNTINEEDSKVKLKYAKNLVERGYESEFVSQLCMDASMNSHIELADILIAKDFKLENIREILTSTVSDESVVKEFIKKANDEEIGKKINTIKVLTNEESAKLSESEKIVLSQAYNDFGNHIYKSVIKGNSIDDFDIPRNKSLFKFLFENRHQLQKFGEESVTIKDICEIFDDNLKNSQSVVDDSVIKYATHLKIDGLKSFINDVNNIAFSLNNYNDQRDLLRTALNTQTSPKQKFEILQNLAVLNDDGMYQGDLLKGIALVKPTKTTKEQIQLAQGIFSSDKTPEEQIKEFMAKFNVPRKKIAVLRKFFEEQSIKQIDAEIDIVKKNGKIPENKKSAYLVQLEQQKIDLKTHHKPITKFSLNKNTLDLLTQQIEVHINLINNREELNNFINEKIYEKIEITPPLELVSSLKFDSTYLSTLFNQLKNPEYGFDETFNSEFKDLIELLSINPKKPLSVLRETIPANVKTKAIFEANKLDYKKWCEFNPKMFKPFRLDISTEEATISVAQNIVGEFSSDLFKSVSKKETAKITKALTDAGYVLRENGIIKDGKLATREDLKQIVDLIETKINENSAFWDTKLSNETKDNAKNEFKDHLLNGRRKDVQDLMRLKDTSMDLYLRLTDDNDIGRNLFLGNHVGCCTSVGGSNSFAAPQHLMNSFVRAMEIVDKSGTSYGNSMCYFAKVDGKLSFIIDSFEANGKLGGNQALTDEIISFAKRVTKQMGQENIPIYFGPNYNKISMEKLKLTKSHSIQIIGNTPKMTYIDAIGGYSSINTAKKGKSLYECK